MAVFLVNMLGTLFTVMVTCYAGTVHPEHIPILLEVSQHFAEISPFEALVYGMPAGFSHRRNRVDVAERRRL
jgi:formate/nitrite transporter FocA (FNT family)